MHNLSAGNAHEAVPINVHDMFYISSFEKLSQATAKNSPQDLEYRVTYRKQKIILSSHIGGATREAMSRMAIDVALQIVDVLQGRKPS